MLDTRSLVFIIVIFVFACNASAQDDLDVLSGKNAWLQYTDARNALYHHLAGEAMELLEERRRSVAAIDDLAGWKERQQWVRKTLNEAVGPFPEKTPLNAKVVRTVRKDFYRIEHVIYESQPGLYVTSSLYIPNTFKKKNSAPAVIYCSGHAPTGYRSDVYQHVILNLVKKGFVVLAFDPVGQGERLEYLDKETGQSKAGGPTAEHSYPGTQAFISGSSQARYMVWDGIRAVDYLLTRKEVDPARIGITGRSGGGTQSSYIAAFDDRIAAAAPECYITSFSRLLQSIGPQDAEQNFFHGISRGIDHGDLLIVRAPKPTLMITTTRDMFSIQGARETAAEVSRIFTAYNSAANFSMVEDDAPHASTPKNREAMYAFFQKHLKNPGNSTDEKVEIPSQDELRVTTTGQVSTELGGETIFSLNAKEIKQMPDKPVPASEVMQAARTLAGYREPQTFPKAVFTGRIQHNGYAVEKYFVPGEGDYVVPFLLATPLRGKGKIILYLHPSGKAAEASEGREIETLVKAGYTVLAPDVPGIGELGAGDFKGDAFIGGISHNIWYSAMLVGRSITGVQAGDLIRVLKSIDQISGQEIHAIARKEMASLLLHTAAFTKMFKSIALIEPLTSFHSLVETRYYHSPFVTGAVPGMLRSYDLPQLASTLAPRDLVIVNPLNGAGKNATEQDAGPGLKTLQQAYGDGDKLEIVQNVSDQEAIARIMEHWSR